MPRHDDEDEWEDEDPIRNLGIQIADQVVGSPQVQGAIERFTSLFDTVGNAIDRVGRPKPARVRTRTQVKYKIIERKVVAPENPRVVMGFGPSDSLTRDVIKGRQKLLAGIWHPDVGGSTDAMQRLNGAVEALLAEVR